MCNTLKFLVAIVSLCAMELIADQYPDYKIAPLQILIDKDADWFQPYEVPDTEEQCFTCDVQIAGGNLRVLRLSGMIYEDGVSIDKENHPTASTPFKAISKFLFVGKSGNINTLLSMFSSEAQEKIRLLPKQAHEASLKSNAKVKKIIIKMILHFSEEEVVVYGLRKDADSEVLLPYSLVLENDEWKIASGQHKYSFVQNLLNAIHYDGLEVVTVVN
jgi:hypothetical protein